MDFFSQVLSDFQKDLKLKKSTPVAGGCINSAYRLGTPKGSYFLKWNSSAQKEMIEADASALRYLHKHSPIRTPEILACAELDGKSYLLLEWISQGHKSNSFWQGFGEQLASQHKVTSKQFGWMERNFIGSLPQSNTQHTDWHTFFVEERLEPQIKLAKRRNLVPQDLLVAFEKLFKELPSIIPEEAPALLHGDLWSGNFLCDENAQPVIFDPSIHFGHRETELAFTSLFGGFDTAFYDSYQQIFPLEKGFDDRKDIHNLYPLLVHVNLFGVSYLSGIKQTLRRFI